MAICSLAFCGLRRFVEVFDAMGAAREGCIANLNRRVPALHIVDHSLVHTSLPFAFGDALATS